MPTLLQLLLVIAPAIAPHSQDVCPPDDPSSRHVVERFVTGGEFQEQRAALWSTALTASDIRVLDSAQDSTACQRIAANVHPPETPGTWAWTGYQVNGYYLVFFRRSTPGPAHFSPLVVLDQNLAPVKVYGM